MFLWAIFFSCNMCSYDLIWFHATVQLTAPGGTQNTGDRITAMEQCGQGLFLRGLPGTGIGQTDEGHDFQFIEDANSSLTPSSQYLESDPGFFRLCWCRPSNFSQCDQPADFNVSAGLFIATGPYSGQSFQCQFGSRCIVMETDLRGVSLASGDQLLPLAECVSEWFLAVLFFNQSLFLEQLTLQLVPITLTWDTWSSTAANQRSFSFVGVQPGPASAKSQQVIGRWRWRCT